MSTSEEQSGEPGAVRIRAHATTGVVRIAGNVTLQVTRADNIEVEDSEIQRVLRLGSGDFTCFKRLYLVVDGTRTEITVPVEQTS